MTQDQLAIACGLKRISVQRAETGVVDPKLSSVVEMARALGMELMLVPSALRFEVQCFVQSGGKVLWQPPGVGAPLSIVDVWLKRLPPIRNRRLTSISRVGFDSLVPDALRKLFLFPFRLLFMKWARFTL